MCGESYYRNHKNKSYKWFSFENFLTKLYAKVETYDVSVSLLCKKMNKETHAKFLSQAIAQFGSAKVKKEELTCHSQNRKEKLQSIEDNRKALQKKLINLERQGMEVISTID